MDLLTATQSSAWILDVVFFVILLLGLLLGTWRGFIKGVCKLAGTIFALFVAFTFCNPFKNTLENWFGMTTAIANGMGGTDVAVTAASWLSIAIAFVLLFVIVKLLSWILGKVGTAAAERSVFSQISWRSPSPVPAPFRMTPCSPPVGGAVEKLGIAVDALGGQLRGGLGGVSAAELGVC